jgi:hypothetical protein
MMPALNTPIMAAPEQVLTAVDAVTSSKGSPATPAPTPLGGVRINVERLLLLEHVKSQRLVIRLDPTFETLLVLLASDRCAQMDAGDGAAFRSCVESILGHDFARLPDPVGTEVR